MQLYQPQHLTDIRDIHTAIQNSRLNFKHLLEIDAQAIEAKTFVGRYFDVPVADGKAFYQVTRVKKNSIEIALCDGICLDGYSDRILRGGGWFPSSVIMAQLKRMDGLRRLLASKNK